MKTRELLVYGVRWLLWGAVLVFVVLMYGCDSDDDTFTVVSTSSDPSGFWSVTWDLSNETCNVTGFTMCDIFEDCIPGAYDTRLRVTGSSIALFTARNCMEITGTLVNDDATFAFVQQETVTDPSVGTCDFTFTVNAQANFSSNDTISGTLTDSLEATGVNCFEPFLCSRDWSFSGTRCVTCSPSFPCAPTPFVDFGSVLNNMAERPGDISKQ